MLNNNYKDIEIRKLPAGPLFKLAQILECEDGWKQLMDVIPVECKDGNPRKYTVEHMKIIEAAGNCQKRSFSEILLDEWGTSGRCRPTVSFLLQCLVKAQLYRAADYVAEELLNVEPPPRPEHGPAARVKCLTDLQTPSAPPAPPITPDPSPATHNTPAAAHDTPPFTPESIAHDTPPVAPDASPITPDTPPDAPTIEDPTATLEESIALWSARLSYSELASATGNFAGDRVVGGGAWGSVFRGSLPSLGAVAIKRLHVDGVPGDPVLQFRNEVRTLTGLAHPNLLPLLGYSDEGPALCLVYRFMKNGSLLDRLACKSKAISPDWRTRMEIAVGSARGLVYLHTALPSPLVHRDVKSANILLDADDTPKVGDFGLVRVGSAGHTRSAAITTNVIGTSAYMAPEAHRGDVSVKMDCFSFGVVLLELITGLPPHDESRNGHDLVTYMYDIEDETSAVDKKAGPWPADLVDDLFKLAFKCLEDKRQRPTMCQVLDTLQQML